jgi:hypothetical protein
MQYGQLFDFIKIGIVRKLEPEIFYELMAEVNTVSHGTDQFAIVLDIVIHKHKIVGLLDCVYCIGFWLSVFAMLLGLYLFGVEALAIPLLTYFFIEKI